jgi:hypothetical protein
VIALLFYPKNNHQLKTWFLLHLGIGSLGLISKFFIIIWFYLVLIQGISYINSAKSEDAKHLRIINLLLYIAPFEIVTRMVECSPFIPYELGKYITFVLLLWGLSYSRNINKTGFILIALLIPGIILGWPKAPDYRHIIFNIMGLINLGLGIAYFGGLYLKKSKIDLNQIIRLITYSLCSALIYTFLKTPDYEEIDFNLSANFDASGGFGSNQVSTTFGLGMFLCFYFWHQRTHFSGFGRIVELLLAGLFFFQGLLTFSRGGIIGGVLAIVFYIIWSQKYSQKFAEKRLKILKSIKIVFLSVPLLLLLTLYANTITNGNLLLRYQGETDGTIQGSREKDLNVITSGRADIFTGDIELFLDDPIWGVGVSGSRYERKNNNGVVAHVELSRLLAEHGVLGLLVFLILVLGLLTLFVHRKKGLVVLLIFSFLGFYTTFHAATRTFLSPLFVAMSYLPRRTLK